jgi:Excreted virulence factor EspC, type VII ESX diderm
VNNGNGFGVITGELTGYAQHTRKLAKELQTLATQQVRSIRGGHGFGPVGTESGFVAALDHFAEALAQQVTGVGKDADALGESVAKAAHTYQEQDEQRAEELIDRIRGDKR